MKSKNMNLEKLTTKEMETLKIILEKLRKDDIKNEWENEPSFKMKNKMKAMISQPMNGKTDEEIIATKEKAIKVLESKGYEVVNTFFEGEWCTDGVLEINGIVNKPLWFLAKSLDKMSECEATYFCKGWEDTRGCKIEHETAVAYGMDIIYEE